MSASSRVADPDASGSAPAAIERQKFFQRAPFALRRVAPTVSLPNLDQQGVKFVEHCRVGRKVPMQEALGLRIVCREGNQPVPRQDTSRVSVGNEERLPAGIKEYGIRGFGS
jgi:hypothetical protein